MKTVSVFDFRNNLASYMNKVVKDETPLFINKFGTPLAVLVPFKKYEETMNLDYFGFLGGNEKGVVFEDRVRRNKKEKSKVASLRG